MSGNSSGNARPRAIDFHAHVIVPEVYAVAAEHNIFSELPTDPGVTDEMRSQIKDRAGMVLARMSDITERIAKMDAMGVDVQVLSASLVHQGLEWADAQTSLRLARTTNDWIAKAVAAHPARFDRRSARCRCTCRRSRSASSNVACATCGSRAWRSRPWRARWSSGDPQLRPFWAKAEALGAVVYIHPGGNRDRRFKRFHLWNSVGQAFEEAMAISSLMYDGVLESFPKLKICISHGGGYMPYLHGPHRSQLPRKGQHPRQHEQAADRLSAHALFRFLRLRDARCCSIWWTKSAPTGCCSARTIPWARRSRSNS